MHHILIIDDEPGISNLIREALTRFGYTVEIASSGWQALRCLQNTAFDLVVTDMYLPDLGGACVIRHIRRSDHPHTPVIGISGTPWMLKDTDCDAVLPKPFPLDTLIETIKRLERTVPAVLSGPVADPLNTPQILQP